MKKQITPTSISKERSKLIRAHPQTQVRQRIAHRAKKSTPAAPAKQPSNGGVAAVDRALAILAAFEPSDQRLTLAELAHRTRFYKSTILRIAQSLLRHGYLRHLDDGNYQIGPTPLMLGAIYQRSLRLGDILLPLMHELADQTGESVSFYSRHGDVRVCLHRVDSQHAVRDHVREGDVLPLDRGSGGRILRAFSGAKGEPYETIRREYCYASVGERDAETAGISVPIFGSGQLLLGALTLAGPRSRIDGTFIANARAQLLRVAARATSALGGDASPIEGALASILAGKRGTTRVSNTMNGTT
jgi:DNA-binding IclR family transcriptional regulator